MGRSNKKQKDIASHEEEDLYSSVGHDHGDRILHLTGEINEHSASNIISGLVTLANQNKVDPITLIVSTYGGSVDEMFGLYDMMKFIKCPVNTVGLGKIMSAGVLILSAGKKGMRLLGRNSRIMIHPMTSGAGGNIFEMQNEANEMSRMQAQMEEALLKETKITKQQLDKYMKAGHDTYITPEEAIKLGIVDKLIG